MVTKKIPEYIYEDKRLGRHIEHDPRSRDYGYKIKMETPRLKRVIHRTYGSVLDQGNLGSCTGNATVGAVNSIGLHKIGTKTLRESDALSLYELATQLDDIPGSYPPEDTGSSGLSVAKAAKQKGYITAYQHAFSIEEALTALQFRAVITGVNWYEGFDSPNLSGLVEATGQIRGGHEFAIVGYIPEPKPGDSLVKARNSWGSSWGVRGYFYFTVDTWIRLLSEQGDCTILLNDKV